MGDTVQSGPAMTNYITKNFRADLVVVHNLSEGLPPMGMWNEMQLHLDRYRAKFARHPIGKQGIMLVLSYLRKRVRTGIRRIGTISAGSSSVSLTRLTR